MVAPVPLFLLHTTICPVPRNLLKDTDCRNAKVRGSLYRLADGDGLYLCVTPGGAKSWQYRYRHEARPQTATLGRYPVMSLAEARAARDERAKLVAKGEHLTVVKRTERARVAVDAATTFECVAKDWQRAEGRRMAWTPDYVNEVRRSIERHLPTLLPLPITRVDARTASIALKGVTASAPDMATKVRQRLRAILDFAVSEGLIPLNPLPTQRRGKAGERRHYPAIIDRVGIGALLRAARSAEASRGVKRAHELVVYTAQRIGEIVGATWAEFDLDRALWNIPRERMKMKDSNRGPHVVPLPPVLLSTLREWRQVDGADASWVCPAPRSKGPITGEAVEKFYRRGLALANKHSPHSWRRVFKTWATDAGYAFDVIESQLDHSSIGGKIAGAYDGAKRVSLRATLMSWYEIELIAARDGAKLLPLHKATA